MRIYDVLIIGGGASGATAAFHLANFGWDIALLEKNNQIKIKPCGGGMAASVQEWLPFDLTPVIDEVIKSVEFSFNLKDPVIAELQGESPFWIVRREKLDQFIQEQAYKIGAEIITCFNVINIKKERYYWEVTAKDGRQLQSRSIIIANGSNSFWPQKFGLGPIKPHKANTTSVRLKGRGNLPIGVARFEFGLAHNGYAWAFPLQEEVNVGVGTFIGEKTSDVNKVLEKFLPNLGFEPTSGERRQTHLRVWNGHYQLNKDSLIVVGDAASLSDPFLAEGIRPALLSGYEGARSINQWLKGESNNLNSYTETMRNRWGNSMAWGKRISQVFYRLPKIGYQFGVKRPTAPQRIAQILSGEIGYSEIAQRVIKRLLFKSN